MKFISAMFVLLMTGHAFALTPERMSVPVSVSRALKSFEPSAIVYLSDLDSFLIASDDTTDDDKPLLFQVNERGQVDSSPLLIDGVSKMTDIESLSLDENGDLLILSSQSLNKNGKDKEERNLFLRAKRSGRKIQVQDSVVLRPLLIEAIKTSKAPVLKAIRRAIKAELDVEAHFIRGGELYVGLKNPQPSPGAAIILKTGMVDEIFKNSEVDVRVWRTIDFNSVTGEQDLLSDIQQTRDGLLLTTTQEKGTSRVWSYDETTQQLIMLQEFDQHRAEGIALKNDSIMIVFDQGSDDPFFAFGKY